MLDPKKRAGKLDSLAFAKMTFVIANDSSTASPVHPACRQDYGPCLPVFGDGRHSIYLSSAGFMSHARLDAIPYSMEHLQEC